MRDRDTQKVPPMMVAFATVLFGLMMAALHFALGGMSDGFLGGFVSGMIFGMGLLGLASRRVRESP